MRYVDADGHVEESIATFSEKYLDPAFRSQCPRVVGMDGMAAPVKARSISCQDWGSQLTEPHFS